MRVLLIEKDLNGAKKIAERFSTAKIHVDQTNSGEDIINKVYPLEDYDLIIVDPELVDVSKNQILKFLCDPRKKTKVPFIVIGQKQTPEEKSQILRNGADDFLEKPIHNDELLVRSVAIIRRRKGFSSSVIRSGQLRMDLNDQTVTVAGEKLALGKKEYLLLEILLLNVGQSVPYEKIRMQIFPNDDYDHIGVFVYDLRTKLKKAGIFDAIKTVNSIGLLFDGKATGPEPAPEPVPASTKKIATPVVTAKFEQAAGLPPVPTKAELGAMLTNALIRAGAECKTEIFQRALTRK